MTDSVSHHPDGIPRQVLREKLRNMRRDISHQQRSRFDQAIRQHLLDLIKTKTITSLAAYWPFDGEPDVIPLCRQLLEQGVGVALPKIALDGNNMEFHAWHAGETLEQNRFGIQEPGNTRKMSVSTCPLLIMPLVGYDHAGNRLGVGSGYYDRYLETMRDSPLPLRIGIAYSLQEMELIESNDWDIPLHGVINENGWFTFTQ